MNNITSLHRASVHPVLKEEEEEEEEEVSEIMGLRKEGKFISHARLRTFLSLSYA